MVMAHVWVLALILLIILCVVGHAADILNLRRLVMTMRFAIGRVIILRSWGLLIRTGFDTRITFLRISRVLVRVGSEV